MIIWNILHVLAVFVAFGFTTGVGIAVTAITRSGEVRTIRTATRVGVLLSVAGAVILLLGIIFGFATATTAGFSLTSKWLTIAYVLAALLIVTGIGVHHRWLMRLAAAAAASPEDRPSAELMVVINDRIVSAAGPITGLLWIALIALMVWKPS